MMVPNSNEVLTQSPAAQAIQAAGLVILAVVGSAANTLVVLVFYRRPALRSPSNRFVLSLVLANLVSALVVTPVLLVQLLGPAGWLRHLSAGLTTLSVTASIFSILTIAVDRYNAVLSPLHYAMTITRGRSRGMIAAAWALAVVLATPPLLGVTARPHATIIGDIDGVNCTAAASSEVFRLTYALVLVTLGFTLPLFALCWIYARMYKAAHRNSERTRRHSVSTNPGEVVPSRSGSRGGSLDLPQTPDHLRRLKAQMVPQASLARRRCSNASFSVLLFREEGKAVKTAAMVIASYLFSWTLFFATLLADTWAVSVSASVVPEQCRSLSILFALSSGCITPFIYVFRNEAARNEALRMLFWWRHTGGKFGANVTRCDTFNKTNSFVPPPAETCNIRRQSLSFCDSISVQSFQIPPPLSECRHCEPVPNIPHADFVATYEVIESPNEDEDTSKTLKQESTEEESTQSQKQATRTRRESVTFRLAFLPQRRCQTCIRQNSDSSSGSGHPLLKEGDSLDSGSGKVPVSQRRQQFLCGRQGSSGDELIGGSGSETGTPRHLSRRQRTTDSNEHNNNTSMPSSGSVILELEEHATVNGRTESRSAVPFQETSLERLSPSQRQDSEQSDTTLRQDSNYSDVTVDSGVVPDMVVHRSQSNSSNVSSGSSEGKKARHKLQRLPAVEDEEPLRIRPFRPAFRVPKCDF